MNYLDKNVLYNLHTKNTTTNQTPLKNALFSVDNPLSLTVHHLMTQHKFTRLEITNVSKGTLYRQYFGT